MVDMNQPDNPFPIVY